MVQPNKAIVTTRSSGRAMIIEVTGEVGPGVPSAKDLADQAAQKKTRIAILDLSLAETIDSEGLRWLEQVSSTLEPAGVRVRVVSKEGSKVGKILRLMKFDRFLLVLGTVLDALRFGRRKRLAGPPKGPTA
ncbi:MAG: STAS domain-containing protein [Armatimonadota bacterium]|nr:STAS domain-containing protein [Armatimonadota bacterium]